MKDERYGMERRRSAVMTGGMARAVPRLSAFLDTFANAVWKAGRVPAQAESLCHVRRMRSMMRGHSRNPESFSHY
jgi:hypothetical protein